MAQMAQDEHDLRHLQIAEQTALDHFVKELRDPEYWRSISYQERSNNTLLAETIRLIEQLKKGGIDILECRIEIGYREWMYYVQFGVFNIPLVEAKDLKASQGPEG